MNRVKDKVCIVTGAASGMGRADAVMLASEGAKVVLTDLNEKDGQAAAAEIGDNAVFVKHNVTSEDDWKTVIETAVSRFGGLDVLVNNAGMMTMGSVVDCTLEDYRKVNAVNSEGVFLGCKYAIPAMEKTGRGGSIINMSSVAALHGMSFIAAYSASKGAVAALTKSVALHCREKRNGIRCNSIHPDGVKTPMVFKVATGAESATREEIESLSTEANPMCEPEDIAALVVYLASDESKFVNAAEMLIDNAATATPPIGV
ncbi:3(or 17)beta-hydroxysteroid dehydrogenase [Litorivivens lipolytica]|uniref:3(Or 17)beta-hydroxysteroid dehydrogenase n=1 Tax=Litorivivens lipolytica TaxID=1524264 RepID=A0A7W4W241_9GAMM|nr:SDR family oxidoreductase [Litorivivens lipolytica]MBB3045981.1 3(or 17)beta-hydroxysteroid dehydrogenase [Litorivivens lipolytica]